MSFTDQLASLVAKELPHARRDPERLSTMIERLAHALGMTIAIGCGGDSNAESTMLDGAQNYLDEVVAEQLPFGKFISS